MSLSAGREHLSPALTVSTASSKSRHVKTVLSCKKLSSASHGDQNCSISFQCCEFHCVALESSDEDKCCSTCSACPCGLALSLGQAGASLAVTGAPSGCWKPQQSWRDSCASLQCSSPRPRQPWRPLCRSLCRPQLRPPLRRLRAPADCLERGSAGPATAASCSTRPRTRSCSAPTPASAPR